MPLDTRIALGGQPLQLESPVAQYGQFMNVMNAGAQNQLAQMQMEEARQMAPLRLQEAQARATTSKLTLDQATEADNYVKTVMAKAAEHSEAPRDPFAAAEQMFNHPNPMVRAGGEQLLKSLQVLQAYKNQRDYEASRMPVAGAASVNATAAPMVAPTASMPNALASAVAPNVATEPAVNAMVKPINPLQDAAALLKKIQEGDSQFARGGTPAPGWKNDRELLVKAFEQSLKPESGRGGRYLSLGAGKALDQDTGQIISADKVPVQGNLPIVAKGGAGKAATGGAAKLKAPSGYRYDASGTTLEPIPGGPADKQEKLKPIPAHINTAISTNDMSIKRIQEALDLIKKNPDAIGLKNLLPGQALDRMDPKGVAARSAIGDIGSLVIHERSGAAVSASEMQRLNFIPTPTDRADNAKTKLEAMLRYAKLNQQGLTETYAEDQGYKSNPTISGKNSAPPSAAGAGEWKVVK